MIMAKTQHFGNLNNPKMGLQDRGNKGLTRTYFCDFRYRDLQAIRGQKSLKVGFFLAFLIELLMIQHGVATDSFDRLAIFSDMVKRSNLHRVNPRGALRSLYYTGSKAPSTF